MLPWEGCCVWGKQGFLSSPAGFCWNFRISECRLLLQPTAGPQGACVWLKQPSPPSPDPQLPTKTTSPFSYFAQKKRAAYFCRFRALQQIQTSMKCPIQQGETPPHPPPSKSQSLTPVSRQIPLSWPQKRLFSLKAEVHDRQDRENIHCSGN